MFEFFLLKLIHSEEKSFVSDNIVYTVIDEENKLVKIGSPSVETKLNAVSDVKVPINPELLSFVENEGINYTVSCIGVNAFSLSEYQYSIGPLILSPTIKRISAQAFNRIELESINLGSVEVIEENAFNSADFGPNITIPDTTTTLGSHSFYGSHVVNVFIGAGLETFDVTAFGNCDFIELINISDNNKNFAAEGGFIMNKEKDSIFTAINKNSGVVPDTVKTVKSYAFSRCSNPVIPQNVETIEEYAYYASGIKGAVVLPDTLTTLGQYAFASSTIGSVKVSSNLKVIPVGAFTETFNLKGEIDLTNVRELQERAFAFSNIKNFKLGSALEVVAVNVFPKTMKRLELINNTVFTLYENGLYKDDVILAFCTGSNATITLKDGLKVISPYAFYGCKSTQITNWPSTIEEIGDFAFFQSQNLEGTIDFSNVKKVGMNAFFECKKISANANLSSVVSLGSGAFKSFHNMKGQLVLNDAIDTIGEKTFYETALTGKISLPDAVTEIGEQAFSHIITPITEIYGKNIVTIKERAFSRSNITAEMLKLPEKLVTLEEDAFSELSTFNGVVAIPASLKTVSEYAFEDTEVKEFHVCNQESFNLINSTFAGSKVVIKCEYGDDGEEDASKGSNVLAIGLGVGGGVIAVVAIIIIVVVIMRRKTVKEVPTNESLLINKV